MRSVRAKLIRDKIPEIAAAKGQEMVVYPSTPRARGAWLLRKLREEADEVFNCHPNDLEEELADLLTVMHAIADHYEIGWLNVVDKLHEKRAERGGFDKFLIWYSND